MVCPDKPSHAYYEERFTKDNQIKVACSCIFHAFSIIFPIRSLYRCYYL